MMIHSAVRRYIRPSAIMLPQLGMLGGDPAPRKLRAASTRIALAHMKVPCTYDQRCNGLGQYVQPQDPPRLRSDGPRRLHEGLLRRSGPETSQAAPRPVLPLSRGL